MYKNIFTSISAIALICSTSTAFSGPTSSKGIFNPNTPSLTVVNTISDVNGYVNGFIDSQGYVNGDMYNPDNQTIIYPIEGTVHATFTDNGSGESVGSLHEKGTITATVEFPTTFFGLMGDWSSLPATMSWTMRDDFQMKVSGSTFTMEEGLTGRAFPHLGPVENPMVTGTMALRMAGCAGLREISGEGDYAGKVGTLCLNGTFTFDQMFNGKGVSNCTIAIHDPMY